jgi:hypothetical protein
LQVQHGAGWRFGFEPSRSPYAVLLGGEGWAAELRLDEATALHQALRCLHGQWLAIRAQLMPDEQVSIETECGSLWAELDGTAQAVAFRFVLQPEGAERGLEGSWSAQATEALLAVLEQAPLAEQGP